MAIDPEKFRKLATRGDVAGVAIATMVALGRIGEALEAIVTEQKIGPHIKGLGEDIEELRSMFNELVVKDGE